MKTAYFDCFSGISGNMIIGAMLDAGLPPDYLRRELAGLSLGPYELIMQRVDKLGLSAFYFDVNVSHHEHRSHRNLSDILTLLEQSALAPTVKKTAERIFTRLAQAEAKIHNCRPDEVHFHEVGALDAIIDITGAALGLAYFGIEKVIVSPLHVGSGTIRCAHGVMPIPAPATAELLRGLPIYSTEIKGELVTPTGAAVISALADQSGALPPFASEAVGYGAGSWDLPIPNVLRLYIGEQTAYVQETGYDTDTSLIIESTIDDMNPQFYPYLMEKLFSAGAADVFFTPIIMKKNRPGILLSVTGSENNRETLLNIIFSESSTIGVRMYPVFRRKLNRSFATVETSSGPVKIKICASGDKIKNIAPEWEDCRKLAYATGRPLKEIYLEAQAKGYNEISSL